MSTISIKNWERFQHYKDRDPPWIKLYRDMLTSESWVLGTDVSRLVQIAITLLAARYQNEIPFQFPMLKKVASFDFTEKQFKKAVDFLASVNFLEIKGVTSASNGLAHGASALLATCNTETEQSREENTREEGEQRRDMSDSKPSDVDLVFDHWRKVHNHPRAQLDGKRRTLIKDRLQQYGEADLCTSIAGYLNSPHHMGQNKQGTKYDDIENFLRDAKHVDMGLKFYADPPLNQSTMTRKNVAATDGWTPPEARNASH